MMHRSFIWKTVVVAVGLVAGFVAGILFMKENVFNFAGAVLIGLGIGLISAAFISNGEENKRSEQT